MAKVDFLVHVPVSIMVGESRALDHAAEAVKARVISEASRHRLTGAFMSSVKIAKVPGREGRGRLVTDRLVYSDDKGVLAIEFGRKRSKDPNDSARVPGQFIFTRALSKTGWG